MQKRKQFGLSIDWRMITMVIISFAVLSSRSFQDEDPEYYHAYIDGISSFEEEQRWLISSVQDLDSISEMDISSLKAGIAATRMKLKAVDFWLRYLEPRAYKRINGPLPVEWETEVFEKFEKPYKREGAGLTLAEICLDEKAPEKEVLCDLLIQSKNAISVFRSDSILEILHTPDHFFFANRLFLLNLAAIYTTGFECPDERNTIPELEFMLRSTRHIYTSFTASYPTFTLEEKYFMLYDRMIQFVSEQQRMSSGFDHFTFIKDYVNPLFSLNQALIKKYNLASHSYLDYALNDDASTIFQKDLYAGQNRKGVFISVTDEEDLREIEEVGRILFYDPILSGNAKRSCANCHKPTEYFADTTAATNLQLDGIGRIERNSPSLVNAVHNHLLMLDGKHYSLQNQGKDVLLNPIEMGGSKEDILNAVMSCKSYKRTFEKLAKLTPEYPGVTIDHIVSAITYFYSGFSDYPAQLDLAMNNEAILSEESVRGFNLFMSKAECATCHFIPQFNGVKPPYVGSEFEVLGVPSSIAYENLSRDAGRYKINPATETASAFRTGSIRNSSFTAPYMHNGIFRNMDEVLDFYNGGGGAGHGLDVPNQTLSEDSLHLTTEELHCLKVFIQTLDEKIVFPNPPAELPASKLEKFNGRKIGGEY